MTDGFFSKKRSKEENIISIETTNTKTETQMNDIRATNGNGNPILLPTEVMIEGNFKTKHPIKVESKFHGTLLSQDKIIVEDHSEIKGDLICSELIISEQIVGNIYCTGKVSAKNGCEITGKIFTKRFENDDNTNLNCIISVPDNATIEQINAVLNDIDINTKLAADVNLPKIINLFTDNLNAKNSSPRTKAE